MPQHELVEAGTGETTNPAIGKKATPMAASEGADPRENQSGGVSACVAMHRRSDAGATNLREQMIDFLHGLSAFARYLRRDRARSDELGRKTCVRALAHGGQRRPGTRRNSWMVRNAHIWFDRRGAEQPRGDSGESPPIGEAMARDDGAVAKRRLTVGEVLRGLDQLSRDDRLLVTLVCVDGLSYGEAAEVFRLPVETIISRLARARLALYDVMNAAPTFVASRKWNGVVADVSA